MQRDAQSPQRAALDLGLGAVRMNDRAGIDDKCQLLDRDAAARAVDPDASDAANPSGHVAFLAEGRGNAEPNIGRGYAAPAGLLGDAGEHCGLPPRAAHGVWRRPGLTAGAVP